MRSKKWIAAATVAFITSCGSLRASTANVQVTNTNTTPVPVYQTVPAYDPYLSANSVVEGYCDTFFLWSLSMSGAYVLRLLVRSLV